MAAPIPTKVPSTLVAGDTWKWTVSNPDYRPSEGTISYYFIRLGDGQGFSVTADANWLVTVANTTTLGYVCGEYNWQEYITLTNGERYKTNEGSTRVQPNFALGEQIDTRTKERKIVDFAHASAAKIAAKQVVEATIEGVDLKFKSFEDIRKILEWYEPIVAAQEARATGKTGRRHVLAVFTAPC